MDVNFLKALFDFDTKTLLGVLVWGNLASALLILIFQSINISTFNKYKLLRLARLRFWYVFSYSFLFLRGLIPDYLSVNVGNTLLFFCFYLEGRLLLSVLNKGSKYTFGLLNTILIVSIIVFNVLEFLYKDPALRITSASIIIFILLLIPTIYLLFSKGISAFKHAVGLFYLLLLASLIPRIIASLTVPDIELHSNHIFQTIFFTVLIFLMISNTIAYLLFLKEKFDKIIEHLAMTDTLTEVQSRYSFVQKATYYLRKYKKSSKSITLLFFDIDDFKCINDKCGHKFGDDVLKQFAEIIKKHLSPSDLCGRYGGDEFLVLLLDKNMEEAALFGQDVSEELKYMSCLDDPDFRMTVSIGVTTYKKGETLEDLISRGDQAMYEAKNAGKNRLVMFD